MTRRFILSIIFLFAAFVTAQEDNAKLTLERLFKKYEFSSERFSSVRWLKDGASYTNLEKSSKGISGKDLVVYDVKSGKKEILVAAEDLKVGKGSETIKIENYYWSPDNKSLLIFTNGKRVWRYNTKGDYWVFNLETKKLQQIGKGLPASSLMFAKFSPDNKKVAFVSEHNIYCEDIDSGKRLQLTTDGTKEIINGTTDWVYEEELQLKDAFRWSPDSKKIAYLQLDATGIGVFYMINNTDSIYSKIIPVQYPKVGTKNSACKIGVVKLDNKKTTWMNVPGNPRENYISRLEWAANSDEVMIQHLNRKQNTNRIHFCNAASGEIKTVFVDKDEAWLRSCNDVKWLNNGKEFTWLSDMNGWKQILRISRDGKMVKEITPTGIDVVSILKIDEKNGWVYYIASPENATQRYLFRVDISGNQKIEKLTPENQRGTHSYSISGDAKYAIHTFSNINNPNVVELVSLPEHKVSKTLVENKRLKTKLSQLAISPAEFIKIDIEEEVLDAWVVKPADFDETKKYPVIFLVYGEPAGQTVLDRYGRSYLYHQMLAQNGYVIISVDNRGTPAPRGAKFRKCVYRKVGVLTSADQAAALTKLKETYNWIDGNRIGIWGWSGGGSMTLNMLFRYPDLYHTGISVAPVGAQWLYDTIYQERYMGLWNENKEDFIEGSPVTYAKNLKGNLLLIHGTGDDNVHYQNAELVMNELIKYGKQFQMFGYPNRSHGIYEGAGTTYHLYTMMFNYFLDNLEPGGKEI